MSPPVTYSVNIDINPTIGQLTIGNNTVTFTNSTGTLKTLTINGAINGSDGAFTLNGATPILLSGNTTFTVINQSTIENGNDVTAPVLTIANGSVAGALIVDGSGTSLTSSNSVTVGNANGVTGTLTLSNSATGALGAVHLADGTGFAGNAIMNVQSNADATFSNVAIGTGGLTNQNGSLTVTGSGSTFSQIGNTFNQIGTTGSSTGTLSIASGGAMSLGSGNFFVYSTGLVNITGGGSLTTNGSVFLNGAATSTGTQGKIVISGAGSHMDENTGGGGGAVTGTLTIGGASSGPGTLSVSSAGSYSNTGTGPANIAATGVADIDGGTFSSNGPINVTGTLRFSNSATLGGSGALSINSGGVLELVNETLTKDAALNDGSTLRGKSASSYIGNPTIASSASVTLSTGASTSDTLTMGDSLHHILGGSGSTLHISGSGTVSLPFGNPNYLGDWAVDSGIVQIGSGSSTSGNTTAIPIASGATLEINNVNWGRDLTLHSGSTLRGRGSAFYSRTATVDAAASVTLATATSADVFNDNVVGSNIAGGTGATIHVSSPGEIFLFQPKTYAGDWAIDSGKLIFNSASASGTGSSAIVVNNTGQLGFTAAANFTRPVTINSGGMFEIQEFSSASGGVTFNSGTETIDVQPSVTFTLNGSNSVSTSTVRKTSLGTALLSGANAFSGALMVDYGQIQQFSGNTTVGVGAAFSRLTVGSTASFAASYFMGGTANLTVDEERIGEPGIGSFNQSGGTHTISGATNPLWIASAVGSSGSYIMQGGILNVVNNVAGTNGEAVGFNGNGTFSQSGGTHTVGGSNGNLVVGYSSTGVGTYTISAGLLQANSFYVGRDAGATGTVNVNGGTVNVLTEFLDIALNAPATGTVNVTSGALTAQGIYVGGKSSVGGGAGVLNISGGSVTSNGELKVWNTTGSAITLSSGSATASSLSTDSNPAHFSFTGGTLNITGAGGFTIAQSGALGLTPAVVSGATFNVTNTLTMATGGSLTVNGRASARQFDGAGTLSIQGTGRVSTPANGGASGVSYLQSLSVAAGAALDLDDNDLVVNGGTFTTVRGWVFSGFRQSVDPAATGIVSTTSQNDNGKEILAMFANALVGTADWPPGSGHTVAANAVIGKYTYFGDLNMDGQVTGDDYPAIDSNLNTTPAPGIAWLSGDANLDGIVTGDDYAVIDSNLGNGVGNPLGLSATSVPEPGFIVAFVAGIGFGRRRRRRDKSAMAANSSGR